MSGATRLASGPRGAVAPAHALRADHLVALVSGKGGVGKSNLAANLAVAAGGLGARVLLVDGDLGLANLDVLLGLAPERSAADLIAGGCGFEEALVRGPRGVDLLPAASGRSDLVARRAGELGGVLAPLLAAAPHYDLVLIDAGAGIGPTVVSLAAISGRAWLVTTPEPTALADAYATLKVLSRARRALPLELVVNGARNELEARDTWLRLARLGRRFLDVEPRWRGYLPRDARVADAVARQRALVEAYPAAPAARRMVELASGLLEELAPARGA